MKSPREIKRAAMARDEQSDTFRCAVCGREVSAQGAGTRHRNQCPHCLSSLHLDDNPALLLQLAAKPLAELPFPLSHLRELIDRNLHK